MIEPVTLQREYEASPTAVFAAWMEVETLTRWWGCGVDQLWNVHEWDTVVGGSIHVSMSFDGGEPYSVHGRFLEIVPERTIRYEWEHGQVITVTIEPVGSGSRMTVEHAGLDSVEMGEIVSGGWTASVTQILDVLT